MTRFRRFALGLSPLEYALVAFYARTFGRPMSAVVRGMMREVLRRDPAADLGDVERLTAGEAHQVEAEPRS